MTLRRRSARGNAVQAKFTILRRTGVAPRRAIERDDGRSRVGRLLADGSGGLAVRVR